jgi:hypothetical protein
MISIVRYNDLLKKEWDNFITIAKNGNFLFYRNYMDYHRDRFKDHSLIFSKKNKIIALLPANENDNQIISHQGLTFGGLIMHLHLRTIEVLEIFNLLRNYYANIGFSTLIYKAIPYIFYDSLAQEDLYALFKNNAKLIGRDISSVLNLNNKIGFSETKKQDISKINDRNIQLIENDDFSEYWSLLNFVLSKYNIKPVHTLSEMQYLKEMFPQNIKLYEARFNNNLLAGILVYDYSKVIHTQYMANSLEGRKIGALDYVNYVLINEIYNNRNYFSWGKSTEDCGNYLNIGLIQQKEGMGGRGIILDTYCVNL